MRTQVVFLTKPGSGLLRLISSITLALWGASAASLALLVRLLELAGGPGEQVLIPLLASSALFAYSTLSGAVGLALLGSIRGYGWGHPKNCAPRRRPKRSPSRRSSTGSLAGYGAGPPYGWPRYSGTQSSSSVDCASFHVVP